MRPLKRVLGSQAVEETLVASVLYKLPVLVDLVVEMRIMMHCIHRPDVVFGVKLHCRAVR